ncbi:hypothetical protein [Thermoactinomyces mirandus]|uniref:Uncharacterized protein n=1 Tax=Thermoactinomyces mirandus TaxID=2756294 RepID=A0A7W1XRG4_9BACL|nr:hypothetical protein [Thermoactinomyces mirandus]MBA4601953.1 hypothetical protein [Thermoactinomyces mirandus]
MSIRYWYDQTDHKIIVIHCASGKTKEITNLSRIKRFCEAQATTLEECKQVQFGEDRLGLFKRWKLWKVK